MRTSAELKQMARRALQGNFGNASGAILIIYLIALLLIIPFFILFIIVSMVVGNGNLGLAVMILVLFAMIIAYLVLWPVMMVGYVRLCYRIVSGGEGEINDLFFALRNHFFKYMRLMLLLCLYGFLSSLPGILVSSLLSVGGNIGVGFLVGYILSLVVPVIVLCRYVLALFILVENPELRVMEAVRQSKELMIGNKWRLVRMELSFFGMFLLGSMTMGIGFIWITPYVVCTNALFYLTVKEEKNSPYVTE